MDRRGGSADASDELRLLDMAPPPLGLAPPPRRPATGRVDIAPLLEAAAAVLSSETHTDPVFDDSRLEVGLRPVGSLMATTPRAPRRPESQRIGTRRTREYYPTSDERLVRERASQRVRRPSERARPEPDPIERPNRRSTRRVRRRPTLATRLQMSFGSVVFAGVAYILAASFLASSAIL